MKRASYRDGVAWIALNDGAGDTDRLDEAVVAGQVSSLLLADLFGVEASRVGRDVVRYRRNEDHCRTIALRARRQEG